MKALLAVALAGLCSSGCAYRFGARERTLPGGYDLVAVPVFANKTMEAGIESYFTNALVHEFQRSRVARLSPKTDAQVTILGTIENVAYNATNTITSQSPSALPTDTSLVTDYRIIVNASVQVMRNSG